MIYEINNLVLIFDDEWRQAGVNLNLIRIRYVSVLVL